MIKPSETTNQYWIEANRKIGSYPYSSPQKSGKWLVHVDIKEVDILWGRIKEATELGLLGNFSKVSTAKPNPLAMNSIIKVICIYTYDFEDKEDVMKIRHELRKLGIKQKIPYKTDMKTKQGQYQVNGSIKISSYFE